MLNLTVVRVPFYKLCLAGTIHTFVKTILWVSPPPSKMNIYPSTLHHTDNRITKQLQTSNLPFPEQQQCLTDSISAFFQVIKFWLCDVPLIKCFNVLLCSVCCVFQWEVVKKRAELMQPIHLKPLKDGHTSQMERQDKTTVSAAKLFLRFGAVSPLATSAALSTRLYF